MCVLQTKHIQTWLTPVHLTSKPFHRKNEVFLDVIPGHRTGSRQCFIGSQCLHLQGQGVQEDRTVDPKDEDTTILGNTANYLYIDTPSHSKGPEFVATLLIAHCTPALCLDCVQEPSANCDIPYKNKQQIV